MNDDYVALAGLVDRVRYKPGWRIDVVSGQLLEIRVHTVDSANPDREVTISHGRPVPPYFAEIPEDAQLRWLFDQIREVEYHETAEFFTVDGVAPYHPHRVEQ